MKHQPYIPNMSYRGYYLQRCEELLQNMITSQRISLVESMIEVMKLLLDSYEDLLFVQELLAINYSMLERSLPLSYGPHDIEWCQQFTAHQLSIIGNMGTSQQPASSGKRPRGFRVIGHYNIIIEALGWPSAGPRFKKIWCFFRIDITEI